MTAPTVLPVRLDEDYHVHSTFSDGASTVAENLEAAGERGLRLICLADHVRRDTRWVPEFVAAAGAARDRSQLAVLIGLEAKIWDAAGHLDVPDAIGGVDLILVADHQFPGPDGPVHPNLIRSAIERGALAPSEAIAGLLAATSAALTRVTGPRPLLAHLFSLLPKIGLSERAVPDAALHALADRAAATGALLEVNEKWGCPSARTVAAFAAAGVRVVAGSDSHHCRDIGRFAGVRRTVDAVAAVAGR